jgi:serine/threonine-protein kinase
MPELLAKLQESLAGRYVIERQLGRGGMATVYLAQDLQHERPVALKVLHPELAASLGAERFQREIRMAAKLQHPHILGVYDSGSIDEYLWFTMPFVEGESLRDRMDREGQLTIPEAVRITREAALALDFAHRHGVVHRDIKPENILLIDGQAMVADFGIARAMQGGDESLTQTGMSIGTPAYMSPEQASGERISTRGPTSTRSAACSTRCWQVRRRSPVPRRKR